ncbi:hypothetical protein HBI81_112830 [Parastagonospora nodorum]|nr:hypothetical protein HBI81_112830 [Parastagonospora nodorum]
MRRTVKREALEHLQRWQIPRSVLQRANGIRDEQNELPPRYERGQTTLARALSSDPRHRHSTRLRKPIRFGHSAPQHHSHPVAQPNRRSLIARSDDFGRIVITTPIRICHRGRGNFTC